MNTFRQHGYAVKPGSEGRLGWGAYLSYIGFFESAGDFLWEQTAPMFCIHVIQKGRGVFRANGKKFESGAGEAFTFFPGHKIRYHDFPETPWEYIWIRLDGENVEKALAASGITRSRPNIKIANPGKLKSFLHEIGVVYSKGNYLPLYPMAAACTCLDMISGNGSGSRKSRPDGKNISDSFISALENQMDPAPSINQIAKSMRIDRTTLFRAFIREHGISPKKYLENLRLDKASGLLSGSSMSVKEVSAACGFAHPSHFGKVFRSKTGSSPAEWKRKFSQK